MDNRTYMPVSVSHPGETVLDYLDSFGWSQRDLSRRTGLAAKTVNEICKGKAAISPSTSILFEKVFQRPAHFWMNLQSRYDEVKARNLEQKRSLHWLDWVKMFPINEMKKRGWIDPDGSTPESDLNAVLAFLGVSSPDSWDSVWSASQVSYRQTRKHKANELAVSAWVRAVEIIADEIEVNEYNEKILLASLNDIRLATREPIDEALGYVQSRLASCGVAFVWVPSLPKTGISGCTKWKGNKKVIVALSLRYKFDDQIWFTLFHELGHVLKHKNEQSFIVDNADDFLTDNVVDAEMQRYEDEANRFSADTLIPAKLFDKFISFEVYNNETIYEFAEAVGIAPGIVVGRLQFEGLIQPHQGNKLKQRIDWSFE